MGTECYKILSYVEYVTTLCVLKSNVHKGLPSFELQNSHR